MLPEKMLKYNTIEDQEREKELRESIYTTSRSKNLPLLLPKWQTIRTTLDDRWGEPIRNLQYMRRILRRLPTFVWLSKVPPKLQDIEDAYLIGIEFLHAANILELKQFLKQFHEDVIVVTDYPTAFDSINLLKQLTENKNIEKLFIYIQNPAYRLALPEQLKKGAIFSLSFDLYQMIETYQVKNYRKQNPKIMSVGDVNTYSKNFHTIMNKIINRKNGVNKFAALARFENSTERDKKYQTKQIQLRIQRMQQQIHDFQSNYPLQVDFTYLENATKIIEWYTRECFVYKLLNTVSRGTEDPLALAYIELVFQDFTNAVRTISAAQKGQYQGIGYQGVPLYRRTLLSKPEIDCLKLNKTIISLGGFVSTSLNQETISHFHGNTVFHIMTSKKSKDNANFCFVPTNQIQKQVLFVPGCVFKVKQKTLKQEKNYFYNYKSDRLQPLIQKFLVIKLQYQGHVIDYEKKLEQERQKEQELLAQQIIKEKLIGLGQNKTNKFITFFQRIVSKQLQKPWEYFINILKMKQKQQILANYALWESFYAKHSAEAISVVLPPKDIIADTLQLPRKGQKYMFSRSKKYVDRMIDLHSIGFCIVWFSRENPPNHIIAKLYQMSVDLYHVKTIEEMKKFIQVLSPRNIFGVIQLQNVQPIFQLYLKYSHFVKIFARAHAQDQENYDLIRYKYPQLQDSTNIFNRIYGVRYNKFNQCCLLENSSEFGWQQSKLNSYFRQFLKTTENRCQRTLQEIFPSQYIKQAFQIDEKCFTNKNQLRGEFNHMLSFQSLKDLKNGSIVQIGGTMRGYHKRIYPFNILIRFDPEIIRDQGYGFPYQLQQIQGTKFFILNPLNLYRVQISQYQMRLIFLTNSAQNIEKSKVEVRKPVDKLARLKKQYKLQTQKDECNSSEEKVKKIQPYQSLYEFPKGDPGVQLLSMHNLESLSMLDLRKEGVSYLGIKILKKMNLLSLKHLKLLQNSIGDIGARHLAQCNFPSLKKLTLYECQIVGKSRSHMIQSFPALQYFMMDKQACLETLVLINCNLREVSFYSSEASATFALLAIKIERIFEDKCKYL